ncbi:hypothetical protein [Epilithonimonas hominis]|uniref:hypothetical protein n=1 Tax=Epilithonimonas hominis TaxID=420404 RepID=UPI00289A831F|nr:hypothetical protein [Epilithonimonas hominis]
MKKKFQNQKKIDITALKVIDKKYLNAVYGGTAPTKWTSFTDDTDTGAFCSLAGDTDN